MISKDKTSFVLYTSFYGALQDLPLDRKGMLLDLIFNYEIHGDTEAFEAQFKDLPNDVKMAFRFIKGQLDKDQEKWREVCSKRAAAGRKSGIVRMAQQKEQMIATDNNQQQEETKTATDSNATQVITKDNKPKQTIAKRTNVNFVEQKGTKRTNVNFVEQTGTKRTDNEYEDEYENDVVVDTTTARACANGATSATASPPSAKKIESYRKTLASKFYIKGEDDAFCRAVLCTARNFSQETIQKMANGAPRTVTMDGKAVWQWSERVDIAVGYRVWIERIVAAWDAGKYK